MTVHPLIEALREEIQAFIWSCTGDEVTDEKSEWLAMWILEKFDARLGKVLTAAEEMRKAANTWSDVVDQGFASEMRPDIARAFVIRRIREYDAAVRDGQGRVG